MKILLVATVQSHICQFHKPLVNMLHDHGCEVHVAARNNLAEKNGLKLDFVDRVFEVPFERSPLNKHNITAYRTLKTIIDAEQYDVIHTNTPVGGILGRLASRKARRAGARVFYTAHGFHFFRGGAKKNWMLYYPLEKYMCRYTDTLLTITDEDYQLAKKLFRVDVARIHGVGADTSRYFPYTQEQEARLREEMGYALSDKILLYTGELNSNKNQITAIRAMPRVIEVHPTARLLLAGNGETRELLLAEAERLGLQKHVELLGYRTDLERYVNAADIVLSCSIREGLPLNIIEGMLCEKPVVASVNRGHRELVTEDVTGFLSEAHDADRFADCCIKLLDSPEVLHEFGAAARMRALQYADTAVYYELEELYRRHNII